MSSWGGGKLSHHMLSQHIQLKMVKLPQVPLFILAASLIQRMHLGMEEAPPSPAVHPFLKRCLAAFRATAVESHIWDLSCSQSDPTSWVGGLLCFRSQGCLVLNLDAQLSVRIWHQVAWVPVWSQGCLSDPQRCPTARSLLGPGMLKIRGCKARVFKVSGPNKPTSQRKQSEIVSIGSRAVPRQSPDPGLPRPQCWQSAKLLSLGW